jgi:prevent-host-death family protein
MTLMSVSAARTRLPEILNKVALRGERVVIHRRGTQLAAIVPVEDLELLRRYEDKLDGEAALLAKRTKGSISFAALKKKAGID